MALDSKKIEKIYSGKAVKHYDLPISHMFGKYKKKAFTDSSLKAGDKVIVFCCGTGLDFHEILKKTGKESKITGIDFSAEMLQKAQKRINKNNWRNIELIHADATKYKNESDNKFDVGICTLGISIIPDYKSAYYNLLSFVKEDGEIIIGDMQLASDWYARFNPFTIFLARRFGGSHEGHKNSLELCNIMQKELKEVKKKEFFLKSYFYCIGKK
ncbi:MAG: class I SAM-dependent methyltransferase [Bacteroidales bacterium]|nr:MAG: class I SAM-dependent methyltransferase [Bacteroidales bacterium]